MDPNIKTFLKLMKTDPERAIMSMRSKTIEYLYDWRAKPIDNWAGI